MEKKIIWPLCISVAVALSLSGFAAFSKYLNLESASFPLGVMTLLVTTLVGFQIYNALGIQNEMREIRDELKSEYSKMDKRMNDFEEKSKKKIDTLKSERGILKLSQTNITLSRERGKVYFTIDSNTKWNIFVNNTAKGQSINDLNVFPLNGEGNATITVEYGGVHTENYQQMASISVFYVSYGTKQVETISILRKHLPE